MIPLAGLKFLLKNFPNLGAKLKQAKMSDKPEIYLQKTFQTAAMAAITLGFLGALLAIKNNFPISFPIIIGAVVGFFTFMNLLKTPDLKILHEKKDIEREIIYAGRFLIIELESGVPIYDAIDNASRNYPIIGKHFKEIVDRVNIGIPLEDALNQVIDETPSENFRKMLWQVLNSIKTGADVGIALETTIEQITKEQLIEVSDYGKKLNPIAMFYMIIAVILPSIGVVMIIIFSSFLGLQIKLPILLLLVLAISLMQYMFLNVMQSQRPAVSV